jgi:hypothetical protein
MDYMKPLPITDESNLIFALSVAKATVTLKMPFCLLNEDSIKCTQLEQVIPLI